MTTDTATTAAARIGQNLRAPFPEALIDKNPKGMSYVKVSEIIGRLNASLGEFGWSYQVIDVLQGGNIETETGAYPKWLVAHVRVTASDGCGSEVFRDGYGGQEIQFLKNGKGPVDLGDAYKGAVSDALKKAVQSLGVALHLARSEDGEQADRDIREADEPRADAKELLLVEDYLKAADPEGDLRKDFKVFWADLTGGKKFNSGKVTVREIRAAIDHLGLEVPGE